MKQKLDERQIQEATKIASISFYVMYGVCALAIILQLIVTGRLENVIGETAVIAAGLSICMENGSEAVKRIADEVCPKVTEDGIWKAFQKHHLM